MIEVKFRVWDLHLGIMQFDAYLCHEFVRYLQEDRYITMQYTGLKDRNGREIWEGDVLGDEYGNVRYEVFRIEGGFGVNTHKDDLGRYTVFYTALGDVQMASYVGTNCVVMGNKYENEGLIRKWI